MQQDRSEIISITKAFWLRRAGATLSDEEAREAVENVAGFFRLLQQWHEKDQQSELKVEARYAANLDVDFEGSSMSTQEI